MQPADLLEVLQSYNLVLAVAGVAVLAAALLPRFLNDMPFTVPMATVLLGFVVFSLPLGFDKPGPRRLPAGQLARAVVHRRRGLRAHGCGGLRLAARQSARHAARPGLRRERPQRIRDGMGAFAATLIVYGLTEYAGGYGFVATFAAAATIRGVERSNRRHRHLQGFVESGERIFMVAIMVLVGGAIAGGLLAPLEWQDVVVALAAIFVVRPVAAGVALVGMRGIPFRDRAAISFYGVRGIAAFYYLSYALGEAEFPGKERLWAIAGLIVLLSVVVHGLTAALVLERLDEARER